MTSINPIDLKHEKAMFRSVKLIVIGDCIKQHNYLTDSDSRHRLLELRLADMNYLVAVEKHKTPICPYEHEPS